MVPLNTTLNSNFLAMYFLNNHEFLKYIHTAQTQLPTISISTKQCSYSYLLTHINYQYTYFEIYYSFFT